MGRTYDRPLDDVFAIQSEIAKAIADSLQAKLTGREEQAFATKPTDNAEAYDAYLRGVASLKHVQPHLLKPLVSMKGGGLDPNFALRGPGSLRGRAALLRDFLPPLGADERNGPWRIRKIWSLTRRNPVAMGYYQFHVPAGLRAGQSHVRSREQTMLRGSSEVARALGLVARWEGRWDRSIAYFEQALALDPRNVGLLRTQH